MALFKKKQDNKTDIAPKGEVSERNFSVVGHLLLRQERNTEKTESFKPLGKYAFVVDRAANKSEVKKAVESLYKVKVDKVNIINVLSKPKRLGKSIGRTSSFKKALVTLKTGHKIEGI